MRLEDRMPVEFDGSVWDGEVKFMTRGVCRKHWVKMEKLVEDGKAVVLSTGLPTSRSSTYMLVPIDRLRRDRGAFHGARLCVYKPPGGQS
jgi:hypothetical protein